MMRYAFMLILLWKLKKKSHSSFFSKIIINGIKIMELK